eukprot:750429-Prorocentrum_minimum.AAC.1
MRSRFVVAKEKEVVPRPSPFGLKVTPAGRGAPSSSGAPGTAPPVRAPPPPRAAGGESRRLVEEMEGLTLSEGKGAASNAQQGAGDGLTRADLETFVADFLAMQLRGGPGAQDPLSLALGDKSGVGRVNPAGVKD